MISLIGLLILVCVAGLTVFNSGVFLHAFSMWPTTPQELHILTSAMHMFPARCWGRNPHDWHSPIGGQQSSVFGVLFLVPSRYLSCKEGILRCLLRVVPVRAVWGRCGIALFVLVSFISVALGVWRSSLHRRVLSYSSSVVSICSYLSLVLMCASRAFNSFVVSLSMRDIHRPIVTSWTGSAYHMALRSHSPESNLFRKVLSVDLVTSQRASFAMDRLVRALIWSAASVISASAVDDVAVWRWLRGILSWRPSADCAMVCCVSAELGVSPGMELTRMIPEEIQGATISYD